MLVLSCAFVLLALILLTFCFAKIGQNTKLPFADQKSNSFRKRNVFGTYSRPIANLIPHTQSKRDHLQHALIASGQFETNALVNFLAKRNAFLIAVAFVVAFLFAVGLFDSIEMIGLVIFITIIVLGYSLPSLYVSAKANRRIHRVEKNLPDALDLMALSIGGGLPLARSFELVTKQLGASHPALAEEFRIISRQSKSGSIDQAFSSFSNRMKLPEVTALCSLMRQNQRLGTKLVDALIDFSNRIREDRRRQAEHLGNTATIKLLLPVVTCLAPPIFILLIGPAFLDLRDFINRERELQPAIQNANEIRRPVILEEGNSRRQRVSPDSSRSSPIVSSFGWSHLTQKIPRTV